MQIDIIDLLRELEFTIAEGTAEGSWQLRSPTGAAFLVHLARPVNRLTAHAVRSSGTFSSRNTQALHIGLSATSGVIDQAKAGKLNVLTEKPLQLIVGGTVFTVQQHNESVPAPPRPSRPAWIRRAVERCLLLVAGPLRQSEIADLVGTSQQSVSTACRRLGSMVAVTNYGAEVTDPEALLAHWLKEYPGAGGQEFGWYSLDPVVEQTLAAFQVAKLLDARPLISGDVAADKMVPWKLPAKGRVYVDSPIDLAGNGFVPAPLEEATLVTCVPRDPTLWKLTGLEALPVYDDVQLADPALVYWDLYYSGDLDSLEAANHLKPLITGTLV